MVFYYSRSLKTKFFAETLGEALGRPVYELKSDINEKSKLAFYFTALGLVFNGRGYPVSNMPTDLSQDIYVCGPVWGGQMVGPPRYFLDNANLKDIRVNLLLTASVPVDKYRRKALEYLNNIPCIAGEAYIFATSDKIPPDKETLMEQFGEMLQ